MEEALERLAVAQQAVLEFQIENQMVDPQREIQILMGVLQGLQQNLITAQIELDLLLQSTSLNDPRVLAKQNDIDVIESRIQEERIALAQSDGVDYPRILGEFQNLILSQEYASEVYRAALVALDNARIEANRQSRYLAVYIPAVEPTSAEYPKRALILGLVGLFLFLAWSISTLIYYAIRDGR